MAVKAARRWTEEDVRPRLDLRLVIPALAVWAGCLVGLGSAPASLAAAVRIAAGVVSGGVLALLAGRWTARRRPQSAAKVRAVLTVALCGAAAVVLTVLRVGAATDDPLSVAAARGDWVRVEARITADPVPVAAGWSSRAAASSTDDEPDPATVAGLPPVQAADPGARPAPTVSSGPGAMGTASSDEEGAGLAAKTGAGTAGLRTADSATRWRITAHAQEVETRGLASGSSVAVTIFATGAAWGEVRTGETVILRGTAAVDELSSFPAVTVGARADPQPVTEAPWWFSWAGEARQSLARSAAVLGSESNTDSNTDTAGLLRGLVVGDTRALDADLSADAKTTGLTHLVAVSGSHLAVIAGAVLLLLRRFGPRVSGAGVAATFAALILLVGPQPSVLRSVVMGLIGVLAAVIGRARTALSALAAAVFALLLIDPGLAASVGFTLSVQATAGLVLIAPVMTKALRRRGVPSGWATLVAMAVAAHLATMPVIAAISGSVSLAAIPANIAVAPVVAPALLIGLACLIVGPWWPDGGMALAKLDGPLLGWIAGVAHRLASWSWATLPWSPSMAGVLSLALVGAVAFALIAHRITRRVTVAAAAGVILVLAAASVVSVGWPATGWLMTMCDVGQGDGIVLATDVPGEAVVVDTGPEPAPMDACLDRLGIDTIALLVVTHLHADHVGGIAGAADGRTVDAIGLGPDRSSPAALADVAAVATRAGAPVIAMTPGARWQQAGLTLDVLGPTREYHGTDSDPNNDSVVLRATRRGVRILLTGDIERPAQQSLIDSGADLTADVLKQPHHGSAKLLPAFVAAVSARVAVIGVGAGNDYGHPAATALRTDRSAGIATILRTDTDGDVQVVLSGGELATVRRGTAQPAGARR